MVHHPQEAQRGQDPDSDLFSPGYFSGPLAGGQSEILKSPACQRRRRAGGTRPLTAAADQPVFRATSPQWEPPVPALEKSPGPVHRQTRPVFKTVIAGYPWFLDWGRDTLIVVRGIIAAGRLEEALSIIQQFAAFEERTAPSPT
jgi:starch synthase (maltosyl-transferring)